MPKHETEGTPHMIIATITRAYMRRYSYTGQTVAYVDWIAKSGAKGRTEGPPDNSYILALFARAVREGLTIEQERDGQPRLTESNPMRLKSENDRSVAVNALLIAAEVYERDALTLGAMPHLSEKFRQQAADARRIAEQIEQEN